MEDMTAAVAAELAKWWPEMTIYRENQPNGFLTPSFYVHRLPTHREPDVIGHNHELRTYSFQIVYFPSKDGLGAHQELDDVRDKALDCLHIIGGNYRTTNWTDTIETDEVEGSELTIAFDLPVHVQYEQHPVMQEHMDYTGDVKDDTNK